MHGEGVAIGLGLAFRFSTLVARGAVKLTKSTFPWKG